MATEASSKVWFITGCSSGIGRELALAALERGDKVIATARNADKLDELKQRGAHTIALDVTWPDDAVQKVVADAIEHCGGIDILVNNAGYSLVGAADECSLCAFASLYGSEKEIFDVFNTNVFGIYKMLRAVLPYMRRQKSGVIANVGSIGGWRALPANGVYCTTKFAVAGLSESLRAEVAHLNIDVTCIDLGSFRTSFGNNVVEAQRSIEDVGPAVEEMKKYFDARNGTQPGDPAKAAKVLVEALTKTGRCAGRTLPTRLAVGSDAALFISNVLEKRRRELQEWVGITSATDHDDAETSPRLV
ncbi:Dehydrogenase, partial [Globisporangium splendens]